GWIWPRGHGPRGPPRTVSWSAPTDDREASPDAARGPPGPLAHSSPPVALLPGSLPFHHDLSGGPAARHGVAAPGAVAPEDHLRSHHSRRSRTRRARPPLLRPPSIRQHDAPGPGGPGGRRGHRLPGPGRLHSGGRVRRIANRGLGKVRADLY